MSIPILQLASNQRDIWLDQIAHPESPVYNIGGTLIISGKVDYKTLNLAIQQLIKENDVFRIKLNTHIPIQQKLVSNLPFQLEFIDFSLHPTPKDTSRLWLDKTFKQPFSYNKNNQLWHFALIKESEQRYYLLTKYHHVIADGWSTTVVIARLAEIYNAFLKNQMVDTKSSHHYFDYIEKEQQYLSSPTYNSDDEYWKNILPEPPTPLIPRRYPISFKTLLPNVNGQ